MPSRSSITSKDNPLIKRLKLLATPARRSEGVFLLEGLRLVEAAVNARFPLQQILVSEAFSSRHGEKLQQWESGGQVIALLSDSVFRLAADTVSPQGIAALAVEPVVDITRLHQSASLLLLDNIRDPGNLGTLLRTAKAAAMDGVLLSPGCADVYSTKVVRSAMGAHFNLLICQAADWNDLANIGRDRARILADAQGQQLYWDMDWATPLVLVISNEASGASPEARQFATQTVRLPMAEGAESLNAAVAGSILMYEILRRRPKPL